MVAQQTLHPDRKDELLTTLADARRRAILTYLQEAPRDVATVETLADELDTRDPGRDDVTEVTLVHSDLPKLDAAGVIEFDQRSNTARYRANTHVERLLDVIVDL